MQEFPASKNLVQAGVAGRDLGEILVDRLAPCFSELVARPFIAKRREGIEDFLAKPWFKKAVDHEMRKRPSAPELFEKTSRGRVNGGIYAHLTLP